MSDGFEFPINTGDPALDQQTLAQMEAQYQAAGMTMTATASPGGGFHVKVAPAGAAPAAAVPQPAAQAAPTQPAAQDWQAPQAPPGHQGWQGQAQGQPPAQQAGWGQHQQAGWQQPGAGQQAGWQQQQAAQPAWGQQPAYAAAGAAGYGGVAGPVAGIQPLGADRVKYLRKVYSLLAGACFVAIVCGWAAINVGPTVTWEGARGEAVEVPWLVSLMLESSTVFWATFAVLVGATFVASWVSKVRHVNVFALFAVGAIMGIQLAPMSFVAMYFAGLGDTLSANPIRDAGLMTMATFVGITAYVFVTRKDFSYLKAFLSIGFFVILVGCILTFVLDSEIFALAVATGGALLSAGFLLYVTSYIFRNSEMDDAVGDALAILVQLRNLFMFLLRIFMSSRN